MLTGGVTAILIEFVAFRWIRKRNGQLVYFFVTSITMLMLLQQILIIYFGKAFDYYPITLIETKVVHVGEVTISTTYILTLIATVLAFGLLTWTLKKTKVGIAIRAASNDLIATG